MSLASTGWTLGTFMGPILTGTLVEQVGYYEMECVLGRSFCATCGDGNRIANIDCSGDLFRFLCLYIL